MRQRVVTSASVYATDWDRIYGKSWYYKC